MAGGVILTMARDKGGESASDRELKPTNVKQTAVGLAILKELGSNESIMGKKIFEQEQIARAVELGIGVKRPEGIEILTDDKNSKIYAERVKDILLKG